MTAMNISRQPIRGAIGEGATARYKGGCKPEEAVSDTVTLCEFALDRADEARQLLGRL
jgi:hypothetical protein